MSTTSQKAKQMFGAHKQKSSVIKISPTQAKGQKLERIKTTAQANGVHHTSFA